MKKRKIQKGLKCNDTFLEHILDTMDQLHVLSEILKQVKPNGCYIDDSISPAAQKRVIEDVQRRIVETQESLDTLRLYVSPEPDTPADKAAFARAVKHIKHELEEEQDESGYFTGRAMDRMLLNDDPRLSGGEKVEITHEAQSISTSRARKLW